MEEQRASTMRLKQTDVHPLSAVQHNGNENSLSDSTITTTTSTTTTTTNNRNNVQQYNNQHQQQQQQQQQLNNLHHVVVYSNGTSDSVRRRQDTLQWCNSINTIQQREQQELTTENVGVDRTQHQQPTTRSVFNINNTLAATLPITNSNSRCDESSPDDSLLDYEEAQQSCSSVDTSPQDEDRGFDLSDTESLSDDGNISGEHNHVQPRGIVNPNYPGFQHLAHTLDYTIKACSDTDFTDDDLDLDCTDTKLNTCDVNTINNNNNNNEDIEYKIDSVNRLDSVENIQKVFYDKPKLNIPLEFDTEKRNNCISDSGEEATGSSNATSDEDLEGNILQDSDQESSDNLKLNITESFSSSADIIGDLGKEIEYELKELVQREIEQVLVLEEAVEKLTVANDLSPSALKYNIEPNADEPFEKATTVQIESVQILESAVATVKQETSESLTDQITSGVVLETKKPVHLHPKRKEEDFIGFRPELVKEMAEIKIAKVTSSEALAIKLNQPFSQAKDSARMKTKTADAFLSEARDNLPVFTALEKETQNEDTMDIYSTNTKLRQDSNREVEEEKDIEMEAEEVEKFCKEDKTKDDIEKDEDSTVPRKKEKMEINYVKKRRDSNQQITSLITIPRRELGGRNRENIGNRRSVPAAREKKKASPEVLGGFDVYNIETAMPKIDLDAIESHLRAAREEERRRRTDREEIRRRLAMGSEDDYYNGCDRPGRKPSLQARLQSGMNLQICFMNETASDTESPNSDTECSLTELKHSSLPTKPHHHHHHHHKIQQNATKPTVQPRPVSLPIGTSQPLLQPVTQPMTEADFFARQARLQTEARMALAQAKEMAHMQMEVERQRQKKSPITEMIRSSLEKVGIPFPEERRRVSRQILTEMNVAQLQVIVNDLHTQIETLNEHLVRYLMNRDDLHMEQDSMLVDIEDLTRYLGAKEQTVKEQKLCTQNNNIPPPSPAPASPLSAINNTMKPRLHRIASLVKK